MSKSYKLLISFIIFLGTAGSLVLLVLLIADTEATAHPRMYFLNVGQGDATLVRYQGINILFDGGPNGPQLEKELDRALPWFDRTIDIMLLTHPNLDHLNGFIPLLDHREVRLAILTGVSFDSKPYRYFLNKLDEKHIPIVVADKNTYIPFKGGALKVLFPLVPLVRKETSDKNVNETSIIVRVGDTVRSVLITGDTGAVPQRYLARIGPNDLHASVLKIAHHGSKYDLVPEFIRAVRPDTAVIEVGAHNRFGHPAQEVIAFIQSLGIRLFRTDQDGTIKIPL